MPDRLGPISLWAARARAARVVAPARALLTLYRVILGGVALALVALALGGCGRGTRDGSGRHSVVVYAASSLTETFQALGSEFEREHPDVALEFNFAGSQVLRLQIEQGAPADVFASADAEHMRALSDADLVGEATLFAHNELALIVPTANPAGLERFEDLPRASRIVLADTNAPIGRYTREVLARAGTDFESAVLAHLVSQENNVRLVRAKVELGEADAAIVYRTDAAGGSGVRLLAIPEEVNVRADYFIAAVTRSNSDSSGAAAEWLLYLQTPRASAILTEHGFIVPRRQS